MFFRVLVLMSLLTGVSATAGDVVMGAALRYREPGFGSGVLDQTLEYHWLPSKRFDLSVASRFSQRAWSLYGIQYRVEAQTHPFSFFSAAMRLGHTNLFESASSTSELMLRGELHATLLDRLRFFLSAGWALRPTRLRNASPAPNLFSSDFTDPTWAASLGLELQRVGNFGARFSFGNIDNLETFNLNNPFFELGITYEPRKSALRYTIFSRYKVLLGFGRLDEFLIGVRMDWLVSRSYDAQS